MKNFQVIKAEKILGKVKKVALTGTAMAILGGVFMTGGTQAFADEIEESVVPISEIVKAEETTKKEEDTKKEPVFTLESFQTNNDIVRRAALEEAFGIELDEKEDVWVDKYNQDPTYTSHDALKVLNSYGMNASRQELIKYGIRTDDWQPYDALSAMERPAFYEFINGKFVKNKFYYGWLIESQVRSKNALQTEEQQRKSNGQEPLGEGEHEATKTYLEILTEDFKNAPGVTPYVVGFNSNAAYAKEFGVEQPGIDFYNSKWNHQDVMLHGRFSPEEQQKQVEKALEAEKEAAIKADKLDSTQKTDEITEKINK